MSARRDTWYAGGTETGLVRAGNEDAYLVAPPLYAVADGLGGHLAGEVASTIAIDTLLDAAPRAADCKALGRAARVANAAVIEAAESGRGRSGMGTTLTAAMIDGTRIALAHVGDSRAYLLHFGQLERLTQDHSMVADMVRQGTLTEAESRVHPNRSVITRALGSDPNMVADAFEVDAAPGDRLLLATDGLTGMVEDARIAELLGAAPSPADAVASLIEEAMEAGGSDNITVVVVDIASASQPASQPRDSAAPRWWLRLLWLLAALAIIGGAAYAAYAYARSQAYLISENGVVVVYEGVPGSVGGVSLSWRSRVTTVPVDALDPITSARLGSGVRVDSLAEAEALARAYAERAAASAAPGSP